MAKKLVALMASYVVICGAGPLEGFFKGPPIERRSQMRATDIERCLIENSGVAPFVYRQPDRPTIVTMIWENTLVRPSVPVARVQIEEVGGATIVRSWKDGSKLLDKFSQCI